MFLSRSVLQKVRERPMVTGTQIANEILEMYKEFCDVSTSKIPANPAFCGQIGQKVDFKNVQRRVYDALNVLSAMDIIRKDKYNIIYNHYNEHIPADFGYSSDEDSSEIIIRPDGFGQDGFNEHAGAAACSSERFTLSEEVILQREKELVEGRKRVRDKQKLFLELIKQQVSITKLKQRNIEVANALLNDGQGHVNVDKSVALSSQKLQLPLLFVEC